jgi:hypothetical protein
MGILILAGGVLETEQQAQARPCFGACGLSALGEGIILVLIGVVDFVLGLVLAVSDDE